MNVVFLICGFIAIAFVLFISIYLIVSGIPAIREIGLVDFLFGTEWASTAAEPKFGILPFILTSVYGTCGRHPHRRAYRLYDCGVPVQGSPPRLAVHRPPGGGPAGGHPFGGVRPDRHDGAGALQYGWPSTCPTAPACSAPSSCWPS